MKFYPAYNYYKAYMRICEIMQGQGGGGISSSPEKGSVANVKITSTKKIEPLGKLSTSLQSFNMALRTCQNHPKL